MFKRSLHAAVTGILILFTLSGTAWSGDHQEAFITAQNLFENGLRGTRGDNVKAAEQFRLLSEQEQGNPLFLAYYGSTFAVKSRDAYMPWNKLKLGDQGLDLIDRSLRMLTPAHDSELMRGIPVSLETRLVAITTFLKVPDRFFHRYSAGQSLLAETMKSRLFLSAPSQIRARYYFQAAVVARKEEIPAEEERQLRQVLALDPQSRDADAAHARLREMGR